MKLSFTFERKSKSKDVWRLTLPGRLQRLKAFTEEEDHCDGSCCELHEWLVQVAEDYINLTDTALVGFRDHLVKMFRDEQCYENNTAACPGARTLSHCGALEDAAKRIEKIDPTELREHLLALQEEKSE